MPHAEVRLKTLMLASLAGTARLITISFGSWADTFACITAADSATGGRKPKIWCRKR